jgi:RimJ/RimL family protein N-acetyltransferase
MPANQRKWQVMNIKPLTLKGAHIRLEPLLLSHHSDLCQIGLDKRLWQSTTIRLQTPDDVLSYIQNALQAQIEGTAVPFVIIENSSNQIIGSTRYHSINQIHRRVEIGFTWIAVEWQRTVVNTEAKYLMLRHAFEELGCVRVEFKADSSNEQSRNALIRIGAKHEGILRSYLISPHKGVRDVALFSITTDDWPTVKTNLKKKLDC